MKSILIGLICLPLLLAACTDTPAESDKAQIVAVQNAYDTDFLAALQSDGLISPDRKFADTQALIATTRATTQNATVVAYMDVLEGMIYLQTNQTGQAALIQPDVTAAARVLKGNKAYFPRDAVFAKTYASMVAGRSAMSQLAALRTFDDADLKTRLTQASDLTTSAGQITSTLCSDRKSGQQANPLDDAGAAMVAGFGASFLLDADVATSGACGFDPSFDPACAAFTGIRSQLIQARNLRTTFAGADLRDGTQLRSLDRDINTRLTQAYRGRTVPPVQDACQ